MKKIYNILFIMLATVFIASCSKDDDFSTEGYGYMQVKLLNASTRAVVEGNTLNSMSDAKKVKLSLKYKGRIIEQTLNLNASSAESADYAITSESIKMFSGEYQILGYAIYGDYKSGDMAEVLQVVNMDTPSYFTVFKDQLAEENLYIEAKDYGRFSAHILRLEPETRAAGVPTYNSSVFDYYATDSVQLVFERTYNGVTYREDCKVKAHDGNGDAPVFETDTIRLQTGDYRITHFEVFNKRRQFMYAQDVDIPFTVKHFELARADVGIQMPMTQGVMDGIALKQIWDAMDGESWVFHDQNGRGSNWVFKMSDGSPRPLSAWVNQVGVITNANGRVISLNLGAFNPLGMVPDAIGQLTELEKLYLGEHTDDVYYTLEGIGSIHYVISPYILGQTMDIKQHRMDIARERAFLRQLNASSDLQRSRVMYKEGTLSDNGIRSLRYATPMVNTGSYQPANRITGISEEICKLTHLQELYIANTLIEKLPAGMSQLTGVTDLELYNNPFTELDGDVFRGMSQLTSVNIDKLYNLSEEQIHTAMNKMFEHCPKIQLLYLTNLKLTSLPSKLNHLTDLRLIDISFNKIKEVPSLLPIAPIQVIFDHNELTSLPVDLFNIDDIESFSCTDNKLKEFPAVLSNLDTPYSFLTIDLSGNHIHGFQEGFHGIRTEKLLLNSNYLGRRPDDKGVGEFPREFADTKSVFNYLDVSFNNIDTIRNVALKNLTNIQALDISRNYLRYLPTGFNSFNFPVLTGFDASRNRFDEFPDQILSVSSIQQMLMSSQGYFIDEAETHWVRTMTQWPISIHRHTSLTTLDMSFNDFRTVLTFPTNLTSLNIVDNPNIKMVVPQYIMYKIRNGLFQFLFDESQDVTVGD